MKYICLIIISALWLCGCAERSASDMHLDAAEALIQRDPVAAQAYLDSLHTAMPQAFTEPAAQARYILLDTYCKYRNYEPFPDDSLISVAELHIRQHGSHHDKMLCLYLHGYILMKLDRNSESMHKLKAAVDEGLACEDHFMLGQIYSCLMLLGGEMWDDDQIPFAEKALEHYLIVGREPYIVDSQINLGMAKLNYSRYRSEALDILRKARVRALELKDTIRLVDCCKLLAEAEMDLGMFDSAYVHYEIVRNDYHAELKKRDFDQLAYIFASLHQRDSALVYLKLSENCANKSHISYRYHLKMAVNVYNTLGEYRIANDYYAKRYASMDSVYSALLHNTVSIEQRDYVEQKLAVEQAESRLFRISFWLISLLCIMIVVVAVVFFRYKNEKSKMLARELAVRKDREELMSQQMQLQEEELRIIEERRNNAAFHIKYGDGGRNLCNAATGDYKMKYEDWQKLSNQFKDLMPNFEYTLLKELFVNETEWRICMLLKLDFKPKEISSILDRGLSSISSITNRLYKKKFPDSQGGSKEWNDYIRSL